MGILFRQVLQNYERDLTEKEIPSFVLYFESGLCDFGSTKQRMVENAVMSVFEKGSSHIHLFLHLDCSEEKIEDKRSETKILEQMAVSEIDKILNQIIMEAGRIWVNLERGENITRLLSFELIEKEFHSCTDYFEFMTSIKMQSKTLEEKN